MGADFVIHISYTNAEIRTDRPSARNTAYFGFRPSLAHDDLSCAPRLTTSQDHAVVVIDPAKPDLKCFRCCRRPLNIMTCVLVASCDIASSWRSIGIERQGIRRE